MNSEISETKVKKRARKKRNLKRQVKSSHTANIKFLKSTHTAIRSHIAAASDLPSFLATAGTLNLSGRKRLVEQALVLINDNFVHLPLKRSMHGIDPVQKLRLIQRRLDQSKPSTMDSEFDFHRQMIEAFTSLRDLHTNYLLPSPFADKVAFLPFDIEEYYDNDEPHYIATHFVQGFSHSHFKQGVEVTTWNGVPIKRAVDISADQHAGSNLAARHVRGIDGLTMRGLRRAPPPDSMWVDIGYVDKNGVAREFRQDWVVSPLLPNNHGVDENTVSTAAASLGIDIEADIIQQARKMLFAPKVIASEKKKKKISTKKAAAGQSIDTSMAGVFSARSVTTTSGEFGYIRIFTFNVNDPDQFIDEFARLVELLPEDGLIIDVRGNGGGHIHASEGLLQILTPIKVIPEPTQFINTRLNGQICKRHKVDRVGIDLGPWTDSILSSVETGATYSRGFPITPTELANNRGQKYHGPVVLITDARCYSATDIFAAGFKDHRIGHIIGVDANTGAGGANVWTHGLLKQLLEVPRPADSKSPYKSLPNGANMRVAIRRTLRVGENSGTPVEDLGVAPDTLHSMTKEDLLDGNVDLINEAGRVLNRMPSRKLSVTTNRSDSSLTINTSTKAISRIDIYVDGRPLESKPVSDGENAINISLPRNSNLLELQGYARGKFVAARKLPL